MKPRTWTHPKFSLLQRRLSICPALAAGILEGIWHLAATFDPEDGRLPYTDDELAAWLGVDLAADELMAALVDLRWIDDTDGGLRVHDWEDHKPGYIREAERKRQYRNKSQMSQDCPGLSRDNPARSRQGAHAADHSDSDSDSVRTSKVHVLDLSMEHVDQKCGGEEHKTRKTRREHKTGSVVVQASDISQAAATIFAECGYSGNQGGNLWKAAALLDSGLLSEGEVFSACRGSKLNGKDKPAHFFACLKEALAKRGEDLGALLRSVRIEPNWPKSPPAPNGNHLALKRVAQEREKTPEDLRMELAALFTEGREA